MGNGNGQRIERACGREDRNEDLIMAKSRKNSAEVRALGKLAGRAIPGAGEVIMLVEGTPVAIDSMGRVKGAYVDMVSGAFGEYKKGNFRAGMKKGLKGAARTQVEMGKGTAKVAVAALVSRELAEAGDAKGGTMKKNRSSPRGFTHTKRMTPTFGVYLYEYQGGGVERQYYVGASTHEDALAAAIDRWYADEVRAGSQFPPGDKIGYLSFAEVEGPLGEEKKATIRQFRLPRANPMDWADFDRRLEAARKAGGAKRKAELALPAYTKTGREETARVLVGSARPGGAHQTVVYREYHCPEHNTEFMVPAGLPVEGCAPCERELLAKIAKGNRTRRNPDPWVTWLPRRYPEGVGRVGVPERQVTELTGIREIEVVPWRNSFGPQWSIRFDGVVDIHHEPSDMTQAQNIARDILKWRIDMAAPRGVKKNPTKVDRSVHGPKAYEFDFEPGGRVIGARFRLLLSPDGHVMLRKVKNLGYGGQYASFLPNQVVVRDAVEALSRAERLQTEARQIYQHAREGGFYDRAGRFSSGTAQASAELDAEGELLEKLAYLLQQRSSVLGFYSPSGLALPLEKARQNGYTPSTRAVVTDSVVRLVAEGNWMAGFLVREPGRHEFQRVHRAGFKTKAAAEQWLDKKIGHTTNQVTHRRGADIDHVWTNPRRRRGR
jgi:hypothetical protein